MDEIIWTGESLSRTQMVAIASLLGQNWTRAQLQQAFGAENGEILIRHAEELCNLEKKHGDLRFSMPPERIAAQDLTPDMLVRAVCVMWASWPDSSDRFDRVCERIQTLMPLSEERWVIFFNQVGQCAEQFHDVSLAVAAYAEAIARAQQIPDLAVRKTLLVRSNLNISRIEFMRGVSPRETLKRQRDALRLIHRSNLSAEDALLMLYTGMNEHFCGSIQEGTTLREAAIKCLEQFDYPDMEAEVTPLVGWHYYLLGNFTETISYYESLILAVESREDLAIVAFAYPPIIFSYTFLGEYYKALTLAEKLHRSALKQQDLYAAILMRSNIGRTYIYMDDLENAETVLYQAYAESLQQDYGWGLYYTLLGLCYLQYKKKDYPACREYLALAIQAAQEHGFNPISASPFLLDVLKMIKDRGLEPIEGMSFSSEFHNMLSSQNVHMSGVAYRFRAIDQIKSGAKHEEILESLHESIQRLEISGSSSQLAQTYLTCAQYYCDLGWEADARKFAQLAWNCQTEHEREAFPRNLSCYIVNDHVEVSLKTLLEALWLELRHIIKPERLIARLVTVVCRQLQVEIGAFLIKRGNRPVILLAQNVERDTASPQYQRIIAILAYTEQNEGVFSTQNAERAVLEELDLKQFPRFCACIPFRNGNHLGAALFLESYYREDALTAEEKELLAQFAEKISPHLFATLDYDVASTQRTQNSQASSGSVQDAGAGDFCPSIDENVLILQTQIEKIARTKVPVLITGETGVGKEVFCREIFAKSKCMGPYVKVNCGAIPESLLESELFGYERGSFTGAVSQKKGYFEVANGGTLFLDEIGELTLQAQVKLLRVLQEHEFIRVGGTKPVKVDFRLIAATNKDLRAEVAQGRFRKDLYYRLNVIQFVIPPLRERKSDITNMARFFANKFCQQIGREPCQFETNAVSWMLNYDWPGNVRELENVVQRAVLLAEGNIITSQMLMQRMEKGPGTTGEKLVTLEEMERRYIMKVLKACGGRIAGPNGAAEILGMKRTTLNSKMERLGIQPRSRRSDGGGGKEK